MSGTLVPSAPARKAPVRGIALGLFGLAVVVGLAFAAKQRRAAETPHAARPAAITEAPPEVTVETVALADLSEPVRVTGTLRSDEVVSLSTKATGLVRAVHAREGDRVRRGQLVVEIDDAELRAQRDRAVAAVATGEAQVKESEAAERAARARLQQARTSRGIKNVAAQSDYQRAQEGLAAAKTRLSQAKSLAGIAETESDSRVASAKAGLQAAKERLTSLREGSRQQEKATAEAAVNRAQTQVARMKSALDRREQLLRDKAIAAEVVDNARRDHEAAQADLESARQQLSLVQEGPRSEEIRAQEEVVRQAEAAVRDAEANRARRKISSEDVEAAEQQVRQAQSTLDAAKAALAQTSWNEDEIRSALAAVAQAQAGVARSRSLVNQARADVRYQDELIRETKVYSPVDGVVTTRSVQAGAAILQMKSDLLTVVSSNTLYFEATAPETSLAQLRPGLPAKVMIDALPGRILPGTLRRIIPVAEGSNRSVRLRISLPRTVQTSAVVGGFARAQIEGASGQPGVSVPRSAVVSDEGQTSVFLAESGKAVRRSVQVGDLGGTGVRVPVTSGLKPGERVIVEGASGLTDGQAVTVTTGGSR
jgi:RND family efflux transporter MFP subunit